jgi:hypothetical protein
MSYHHGHPSGHKLAQEGRDHDESHRIAHEKALGMLKKSLISQQQSQAVCRSDRLLMVAGKS